VPSSRQTRQRFAATWLALLLIGSLIGPIRSDEPTEEPLSTEQVVVMMMSGKPVGELMLLIQQSPVDFDLSGEMLEELRAAGLPDLLIQTMQKRQAEVDRANASPEEPTPVEEPNPLPSVRIVLDQGDNGVPESENDAAPLALRLYQGIDPSVAESLGLQDENPIFTDMAVVLGCRTADHVPDHWRSQTPLGRDFRFTPRHKLLAFFPGAEQIKAPARLQRKGVPELAVLELSLPAQIEVDLEPDVAHDLILGIAVQTGNRYYLLANDEWDGLLLNEATEELRATLTHAENLAATSLEVHFRH
jgi:hypothetical protein